MTRPRDATTRLQHAILADARAAGCAVEALDADSHAVPWCSAGFDGTRHHLHFQAPPTAMLDEWLAALDTREWRVPGQLAIDWATQRSGDRLILIALALDPDTA